MTALIAELKSQHDELVIELLRDHPSLAIGIGAALAKTLVLAGASEIEADFQQHLVHYFEEVSSGTTIAVEFVSRKAIRQQFHTYFEWDSQSANRFFSLFGPEFKTNMAAKVRDDEEFADAVSAFLRLGRLRNQIVHQNFAAYSLDDTADEVYDLYVRARRFCDMLPELLRSNAT